MKQLKQSLETYGGFTIAELTVAFDAIADPRDWRNPIEKVVLNPNLELLAAAVLYYTSTVLYCQRQGPLRYKVWADGYRNGPCGP